MGVASPRADAELLAAHVLGVTRGRLAVADGLNSTQARTYAELVTARAARVPLQHLLGTAAFRYLELAVGPGVFVPRPETELLVDWALPYAHGIVADLCGGSGAIALSVAHEKKIPVYCVEQSPDALLWLRRNAEARAAAGDPPIVVVEGDATASTTLADLDGRVDLLLSNPPYVPERTGVGPEVTHDPYQAVFSGADGLDVIRGIVARGAGLLRDGGRIGIEHDDSHGTAVPGLLRADGRYTEIELHHDLAGRPRFSTARRLADLPS